MCVAVVGDLDREVVLTLSTSEGSAIVPGKDAILISIIFGFLQ